MKADLIIAGAGPAGLFAAVQAAANNKYKKILILEKNSSAGKKLLISGSGQCNFDTWRRYFTILRPLWRKL